MNLTVPDEAPKNFDSRRFLRKARAEIEAETAGMSPEQVVEYYRTYPYERRHGEIDATRLPWWESWEGRGDRESGDRNFDCVEFMRDARRKIYEKTKHMSGEEFDEYWRKYRESDPLWQRLTAIEAERARK